MTTKRENQHENQANKHGLNYHVILLTTIALGLLYLLMPVLSPFIVALVLAYIGHPAVDKLNQIKLGRFTISRGVGAICVILSIVTALLLVIFIVAPLFQKELLLLIDRIPNFINATKILIAPWLQKHAGITLDIDAAQIQAILTNNWKAASQYIASFLLSVSSRGLTVISWLGNAILIPVVLFYLLRDWHSFIAHFADLIPRRFIAKATKITTEINDVLSGFLRGQLTVMLCMSVFYASGLWAAGLDSAVPIGVITGLLGFVPYLGFGLGFMLAMLAGALQFTSIGEIVPVLIVFGAGQFVESFLLTPLLVGERIGLHPAVVLFALLACGQLFGFVGLFFALPLSAAIAIGIKHAELKYFSSENYLK